MGKLWVQVCLISAQGLRPSSMFKLQWFAVGWIDPNDKYCTRIDTSGTTNPVWKTRFSTGVDVASESAGLQDLALQVEVYSREPIFLRESLQGKATIALKELLQKCGCKRSVSRPVVESGSFPLQRIHGSSKADQGFVQVSIRVSAEREEPGFSNRGAGKGLDFMEAKKDGLPVTPSRQGTGICPQQEMEFLSEDQRRDQPRKFVLTPRQAVKTLSEDLGSSQGQRIILNRWHAEAEETLPDGRRRIQSPNIILTRRRAVETLYEYPGHSQHRKIILNPRQAVETLSEHPKSNQDGKIIPRQEVGALSSEDLSTNQPRKIILNRRRVAESSPEDPRGNLDRKIILNTRQAGHDDHGRRRIIRTGHSLSTPRRTSEIWSEEQGSNHALERYRPDSRICRDEARRGSLSPPPPPANVGFIPTFFPKEDNQQYPSIGPGFTPEALAAAAIIFGDDFLSGFHFRGGLEIIGVSAVPAADDPYCTSTVNTFLQ